MKKIFILASLCVCLCHASLIAATIVVDPNGTGDYTKIQDAIDNSFDGDIVEVRPGTYHEKINFYGLAITVTGTNPDDMGTVYSTVINGGMTGNTVTFDSGEKDTSVLKGLTVENGGTGIYCYYSDPTIDKCAVRYSKTGPAINCSNASPKIDKCSVRENKSDGISGSGGPITETSVVENTGKGIVSCHGLILRCDIIDNGSNGIASCNGEITECKITGNLSSGLTSCNGQIRDSIIQGNASHGISASVDAEVYNCIISGNRSSGIYYFYGQVKNCTIVGNKFYGIVTTNTNSFVTVTLINNIIVDNGAYGLQKNQSRPSVNLKHNNIWGNGSGNYTNTPPGETDTHSNPRFAIDGYWDDDGFWVEGDYHLKSVAGRWSEGEWVYDSITSPCIDAGDPTSSFATEPTPNGGRINQGVYADTIFASKSPFGPEPHCTKSIPGDVNDDCKLDIQDLAIICSHWLECNLEPQSACY